MKNTYIFPLALATVALILGGTYFFTAPKSSRTYQVPSASENTSSSSMSTSSESASNPTSAVHETTRPSGTPSTPSPVVGVYTMAQVRTHASPQSCWTAINGNVYDVTAWISQHPGGADAILSLCGTDGSASFNGQHGGQARPESELATFKIGSLQ